ncbi:hypothetical protein F4777DRAFT_445285 [Nemania sp. FL0916]|nr:hypothetical protein F4777DRAFT_445285 [Nemania sp. FL0916]
MRTNALIYLLLAHALLALPDPRCRGSKQTRRDKPDRRNEAQRDIPSHTGRQHWAVARRRYLVQCCCLPTLSALVANGALLCAARASVSVDVSTSSHLLFCLRSEQSRAAPPQIPTLLSPVSPSLPTETRPSNRTQLPYPPARFNTIRGRRPRPGFGHRNRSSQHICV